LTQIKQEREPPRRYNSIRAERFRPRGLGRSKGRNAAQVKELRSMCRTTVLGDIIPQSYFSRHALRVSGRLFPFLVFYRIALFPIAKPTALFLNW